MRKTLFLLTTLLSGSLASSQEAEAQTAGEFEFRVIPRFEVSPYISAGKDAKGSCDLGSTSLYTQLEGSLGEHFYYYFSNHWISTDLKSLYVIEEGAGTEANLFRNDCTNWLDMGYVGFTFGAWDLSVGKDMVVVGTFEEDAMDVESHANLNTYFWNAAQVYQWGAKLAWTDPSESSQFFLQLTSSPFSSRPFGKSWDDGSGHLKTFTGGWYGSIGNWETVWSANMMEYSEGKFLGMLGLGNRLTAGDFTFTLDWLTRSTSLKEFFRREMSLSGTVQYCLSPRAEIFVKGGYERARGQDLFAWDGDGFVPIMLADGDTPDYVFGGAGIHYYPIKGDRSLRIHATVAANNFSKDLVSVNVGAMYDFDLTGFTARRRDAKRERKAIDTRGFKAI